jgi:nitrogen fixation/metabolism regulation signal transduction histidine kinase
MVSPLNELVREMATVAKGNFSARVEPSGFPELDRLGDSFNAMVSEIDHLTSEIKDE